MAKVLTAISVANARPGAARREIPDAGCRGLYLVIQPSGHKSWCARFRYRGRPTKLTLGPFFAGIREPNIAPELDTPLSLAAARELATKALREAKAGLDPAARKRKRRADQRIAEADTLQAIAEEFLRREGPKLRTLGQRRADLELLYGPLGRLPVTEIRRGMVTRVIDCIADERGPVRADRVLAAVKRLLTWHAERSDFISPLGRGGRHTSIGERARTRVLSDPELKAVVETAERRKGDAFADFLLFTLYTACRRSEAAGLRWDELLDDGVWVLPARRCKINRDVVIPLSGPARQIVAQRPHLGDYVFSTVGRRPLTDFAKYKRAFDEACGVRERWTIHDVRRSSRTLMSRAGVPSDHAERALGHVIGGARGVYDRHAYQREKAEAFEALAQLVERIVHPPKAAVADMAEARKRRGR
jgi:integrase